MRTRRTKSDLLKQIQELRIKLETERDVSDMWEEEYLQANLERDAYKLTNYMNEQTSKLLECCLKLLKRGEVDFVEHIIADLGNPTNVTPPNLPAEIARLDIERSFAALEAKRN